MSLLDREPGLECSPDDGPFSLHARLYRSLYRIRRVEEWIARVYPTDKIKSPVHLSIGQEAVSVGVCEALRADDVVFGTYRGHALYLAAHGDLRAMIAELYGKAGGCAGGKGGSMHLVNVERGVMGTTAIVASHIPNAVGYAYAMKYGRKDRITACFFGDGAVDEGVFSESVNFAAIKKLPILFICENNRYAIHSHQLARRPADNLVERVRAYGIAAERIEDNDVLEIHDRVGLAARLIREKQTGPRFLECMTYRWMEHVGPLEDFHLGYRCRSEAQPWMECDQVKRMADMISPALRREIEESVEREIEDAFEFAEASPFPDASQLFTDVYKECDPWNVP